MAINGIGYGSTVLGQSVRNLNTLTYIVINLKTLLKARAINRTLLQDIARGVFMIA